MKMNQKAKFRIGVLIYLLLCLALYVCIYIVPEVSDIFVETYVAEYGSLQIGEESEALFVRNERLYTADGGGATDGVISGGSLMRKGSRIVTVGGQGYYSGENGIVSYFYDGLESVLTPETMATADSSFLQKVKQKPQEGVSACQGRQPRVIRSLRLSITVSGILFAGWRRIKPKTTRRTIRFW